MIQLPGPGDTKACPVCRSLACTCGEPEEPAKRDPLFEIERLQALVQDYTDRCPCVPYHPCDLCKRASEVL